MKELVTALVAARQACKPTVHKEGKNQQQGYAYAGHEHVLEQGARQQLLAHGLVLEQVKVEFLGELHYETRNGKNIAWRWRGVHKLVHISGEEREYEFEATTNTNDKSAFVASTALDRTAHLRVLELAGSAEENPEHDSHDRDRANQQRTAPRERAPKEQTKKPATTTQEAQTGASLDPTWQPPLFGLAAPTSPEPRFGEQAKTHAGKCWSEEIWIVEGWLKDADKRAAFERSRSTDDVAWARFLVEHRRRRKTWEAAQPKAKAPDINSPDYLTAEQEAAERALAKGGA